MCFVSVIIVAKKLPFDNKKVAKIPKKIFKNWLTNKKGSIII